MSPALVREGIFRAVGFLGLPDQAFFASSTFAGLFVGTLFCSPIADRYGRKTVFTWTMIGYSLMSLIMAWQDDALFIHLCRFLAGIGIGMELVTIDAFIVELVPAKIRGKAYAVNQAIQFTAVPVIALLSLFLTGKSILGISGWRWIVCLGAVGAIAIWWVRRHLPESPRWLMQHGRNEEAQTLMKQWRLPLDVQPDRRTNVSDVQPRKNFYALFLM